MSPPPWSYWVDPGRFLAGCFPGAPAPAEQEAKLGRLLDLGMRGFVSLMRPDERNHCGELFADYTKPLAMEAATRGVEVRCLRYPIQDGGVPSPAVMEEILAGIDGLLQRGPLYLHCWGGVGRTGTVAACWLLRHGRAGAGDVLEQLRVLRLMDRVRGGRDAPETSVQLRFARQWARREQSLGSVRETGARATAAEIDAILLQEWDPIGIRDEPAAWDEYVSYVGGVYRLLASGAAPEQIAAHLARIEREQMGLRGRSAEELLPVAGKLAALRDSSGRLG